MSLSLLVLLSQCLLLICKADHCDGINCDFCITNLDMAYESYQIKVSGTYCLSEDIIFNPRPGSISDPNDEYAWFPIHEKGPEHGPFSLGFFAAIIIEVSDVELNLNGKTISQHPQFYIQQRFYSHIEIANTPFIPGQGPNGQFGELNPIKNVKIYNGKLGLTSHHGIHSNNAQSVTVSNLYVYINEIYYLYILKYTYK